MEDEKELVLDMTLRSRVLDKFGNEKLFHILSFGNEKQEIEAKNLGGALGVISLLMRAGIIEKFYMK